MITMSCDHMTMSCDYDVMLWIRSRDGNEYTLNVRDVDIIQVGSHDQTYL